MNSCVINQFYHNVCAQWSVWKFCTLLHHIRKLLKGLKVLRRYGATPARRMASSFWDDALSHGLSSSSLHCVTVTRKERKWDFVVLKKWEITKHNIRHYESNVSHCDDVSWSLFLGRFLYVPGHYILLIIMLVSISIAYNNHMPATIFRVFYCP